MHPEAYGTTVTRPGDFDAFWERTLADLSTVPLEPELAEVPLRSTPDVATYEAHWRSYQGIRIAGWYCVPRTAGPHPGLLVVPGYVSEPLVPRAWAREGYAALSVAVRGKLRSNDVFNPGYPGLLTYNVVDRETYGSRGLYCDAWRAVDFLLGRPEVDTRRVGVTGSSQGGALTVLTAAMRPEIKAAAAGAPYLTGMQDAIRLTRSYPYQEVNDYLRLHPERKRDVERTLLYYDVLNFAPLVRCPVLLNIGLQDDVCPPETGFALYRALRCPKELHPYDQAGHDAGSARHHPRLLAFLQRHLGASPPAPLSRGGEGSSPPLQRAGEGAGGVRHVADDYWTRPLEEMRRLSLAAEVEEMPIRSAEGYTTYGVRFTSWGPYRLFAYYSVPRGDGPFPAIAFMPAYGSVTSPAPAWARGQYVTISVCVRGTRHSDVPYRAAFSGAFTHGIAEPERYAYRGVVLDCCRAIEFLLDQHAVDPTRVAIFGDDLGGALAILAASLEDRVASATVGTPALCDPRRTVPAVDTYPLGEVGDELRAHPEQAERVWDTLDRFDSLAHLHRVRARVLLNRGGLDSGIVERWRAGLGDRLDLVDQTGYEHTRFRQQWLNVQLRLSATGPARAGVPDR